MSRKIPTYYWDSCLFIEAFKPSGCSPHHFLKKYLRRLRNSKIQIVTSSISYTEVYQNGALKRMRGLRNLQIVDATSAITIRASDVSGKSGLKAPDAIHLATALYSEVDEFHTRDDDFFKAKPQKYYKGKLPVKFLLS